MESCGAPVKLKPIHVISVGEPRGLGIAAGGRAAIENSTRELGLSRIKGAARHRLRRLAERIMGGSFRDKTPNNFEWAITNGWLEVGRHCHGWPTIHAHAGETNRVFFRNFVQASAGTEFWVGGNHHLDRVTTFELRWFLGLGGTEQDLPASKGDSVIGNDVYIGIKAKVLSGVHVGDGAVVGAYSVVTKDVRPYAVVAGNPAREVRRRFSDEQVEALLRIAWWDWPIEKIVEHVPALLGTDVAGFIAQFDT